MTTLNDVFETGTVLPTKLTRVRVDETVATEERAHVYFDVDLSGTKVIDAIDNNFNVTFAGALRDSFPSQEDLVAFAEKYATEQNPYKVHVNDLGKKVRTPEQKRAEQLRALKAMGINSPEEAKRFFEEQLKAEQ